MLRLKVFNRFLSNSSLYFEICRESYEDFEKYNPQYLAELDKSVSLEPNLEKVISLHRAVEGSYAGAVIFGVMCLEAFIYDYAANYFSNTYVKNYLDKLELKAKWVIMPKLVTGKSFPTECQAFQLLAELIEARNKLVHSKSKRMPSDDDLTKMMEESVKGEHAEKRCNAYQAVVEVLTELRKLDDDVEVRWWQLQEVGLQEE